MSILDKTSLRAFSLELQTTLESIGQRGVRWERGRFANYLERIRGVAALDFPSALPFLPGTPDHDLFFHAVCQARQLIDSRLVWERLDETSLNGKLQSIVKGAVAVPDGNRDDPARNALAELTIASMLQARGLSVRLTRNEADVVATQPGLRPILIECKRPAHAGSLRSNLKDIRTQLRKRRKPSENFGAAVIAADRILDLNSSANYVDHEASLRNALFSEQQSLIDRIVQLSNDTSLGLALYADLGAVVLVGASFIVDLGMLVTITQVGLFFPRGDDDPRSIEIHKALEHAIPSDLSLRSGRLWIATEEDA